MFFPLKENPTLWNRDRLKMYGYMLTDHKEFTMRSESLFLSDIEILISTAFETYCLRLLLRTTIFYYIFCFIIIELSSHCVLGKCGMLQHYYRIIFHDFSLLIKGVWGFFYPKNKCVLFYFISWISDKLFMFSRDYLQKYKHRKKIQ